MSPRIVDRDHRRQQIAEAAIELFGDRGFERTRMEDVARAAGVAKGTLYQYFDDKEALLEGVLQMMLGDFEEQLAAATIAVDAHRPLDRLRSVTRAMVDVMVGLGSAYRFFFEYLLHASRVGDRAGAFTEMLRQYRAFTAELLEEARARGCLTRDFDAMRAASVYAAWFDGALFHWIALPEETDVVALAEEFLEWTLAGLGATKRGGAAR